MENDQTAFLTKKQSHEGIQPQLLATEVKQEAAVQGVDSAPSKSHRVGYGLPCRNCTAYYAANVIGCPYCGSVERSPATGTNTLHPPVFKEKDPCDLQSNIQDARSRARLDAPPGNIPVSNEALGGTPRNPDGQLSVSHSLSANPINPLQALPCSVEGNHINGNQPAAVCTSCYTEITERLQQIEAALCIDVRETAQLIYDAVWLDPSPSDSTRTYKNAAEAVLREIGRRANLTWQTKSLAAYAH